MMIPNISDYLNMVFPVKLSCPMFPWLIGGSRVAMTAMGFNMRRVCGRRKCCKVRDESTWDLLRLGQPSSIRGTLRLGYRLKLIAMISIYP